VGAINEGLGQIYLAAVTQVFCERLEDLPEHAVRDPLLHSPMTGLVRRVLTRQRFPRSSGPKDPKHPVENASRLDARTTLAVFAYFGLRDQRLDNTPLLVSELHVLLDHIRDPHAILRDHVLRNRSNFGYLPMSILRCVLAHARFIGSARAP
jgi:alanyl-tRNA synthetase